MSHTKNGLHRVLGLRWLQRTHPFAVVVALLVLTGPSGLSAQESGTARDVVLSADVGNEIDDQWAVAYLVASPEFNVLGFISAHAPPLVPPAAATSARIIDDVVSRRLGLGDEAPPIVVGAHGPLPAIDQAADSPGARFLIEVSKEYSPSKRLTVLAIGAATDVAAAVLLDPSIAERIELVAMGLKNRVSGGQEFNLMNDVKAWQVLFGSEVPITIGTFDVCAQNLGLTLAQAEELVGDVGPVGQWLWLEFEYFYYRVVQSLPFLGADNERWVIWDNIVLAHLLGLTESEELPRLELRDDMSFGDPLQGGRTVTWITDVDEEAMWRDFRAKLERHQVEFPGNGDTSVSYAVVGSP